MGRATYILALTLWIMTSCDQGIGLPEYVQYMENPSNGLRVETKAGGYFINAQYKPAPYILLKEQHLKPDTKQKWEEALDQLGEWHYFNFSLKNDQGESVANALMRTDTTGINIIQYFAFELEHDFFIRQGPDSIPPVLFHWPRAYGLTPEETFVLGFPRTTSDEDMVLVYDDHILGIGRQNFVIRQNSIRSIPPIN